MADRVEDHLCGDSSRVSLKAEAARKKKASKVKKAKRKYRGLERENAHSPSGENEIENASADEEVRGIDGEMLEGNTTKQDDEVRQEHMDVLKKVGEGHS